MARLESFATAAELEAIWKPLTTDEKSRATKILEQASNYLRMLAKNRGFDIEDRIYGDPDGIYEANVKMVVLNAVQRFMTSPVDMMPDATQWSQSATPYSESMSFGGSSSGTVYFKTRELDLLGIKKPTVAVLRGVR